jgi:hypothetical protein
LIAVTLLDGSTAYVPPGDFIRLRPAATPMELGKGARSVLDAARRFELKDAPEALAERFGAVVAVVRLTTPNDLAVHVAAGKVRGVASATADHHPKARAVLTLPGATQDVRETPDEVAERIRAAGA